MKIQGNTTMQVLEELTRKKEPLVSRVSLDEHTKIAQNCFDYEFTGVNEFYPYEKPKNIPLEFNIGLIVGGSGSGSGKSTLLKEFGEEEVMNWDSTKGIISHFETPEVAVNKLSAVGLNSVPSWVRLYDVLSTGEKFRADLSRRLKDNSTIDEFTSVVDRNVAKSCSVSISKYIRDNGIKGMVFSTCHKDIVEWLQPDWVLDTDLGILYNGRLLRRPNIELGLYETNNLSWKLFKKHHYLTEEINKSARCYLVKWNDTIVGFASTIPLPSGTLKNAWREHRTVILPEFQGMGLGTKISDLLGALMVEQGYRFFSRTAHVRFGKHRDLSRKWLATSTNKKKRSEKDNNTNDMWTIDFTRICYSHEYVGEEYAIKQHKRISVVVESDSKDGDILNWFEDYIKTKYNKESEFLIIHVPCRGRTIIDDLCQKYGIRREGIKKNDKYIESYVF